MKLIRYQAHDGPRWGILDGETIRALEGELWGEMRAGPPLCGLDEARLLAPVEPHNKVIGLGLTYKRVWASYQRREGPVHRDGPAVFMKPPNTNIGHMDPIVYHEICTNVIYEAELGVVIGRKASRVRADKAREYIGGYTCVNDATAQGFTTSEYPIVSTRFKIMDSFCPIGPLVETDLDPDDITVVCRVNDVEVQRSHTGRDLCWPISEMIAWVTSFMTMMPGDIICTGSAGVGSIRVGDVVDVEIDGIGVLSNPVVAPN